MFIVGIKVVVPHKGRFQVMRMLVESIFYGLALSKRWRGVKDHVKNVRLIKH